MRTAQRTAAPGDGSRTQTLVPAQPEAGPSDDSTPHGVLRLRGAPTHRQRVKWDEDTVDNEHLGKKKSKICCIYHKPRPFDESSSSESDSSDDDADRPADKPNGGPDEHEHGPECSHGHGKRRRHQHRHIAEVNDEPSANAYEVAPGKGKGVDRS